jgi:hypothetical protein
MNNDISTESTEVVIQIVRNDKMIGTHLEMSLSTAAALPESMKKYALNIVFVNRRIPDRNEPLWERGKLYNSLSP